MQFRFECVKQDDGFKCEEYPDSLTVVHEFTISDSTRWDNIMMQFAKFLDATGYVGVYDKINQRIEEDWALLDKLLEEDDEDTSNPGCTD